MVFYLLLRDMKTNITRNQVHKIGEKLRNTEVGSKLSKIDLEISNLWVYAAVHLKSELAGV